MEFIVVPETMETRLSTLVGYEEVEAADDVKESCCGG
jgi:hypothetical protein